jgi:hypothetical protein
LFAWNCKIEFVTGVKKGVKMGGVEREERSEECVRAARDCGRTICGDGFRQQTGSCCDTKGVFSLSLSLVSRRPETKKDVANDDDNG